MGLVPLLVSGFPPLLLFQGPLSSSGCLSYSPDHIQQNQIPFPDCSSQLLCSNLYIPLLCPPAFRFPRSARHSRPCPHFYRASGGFSGGSLQGLTAPFPAAYALFILCIPDGKKVAVGFLVFIAHKCFVAAVDLHQPLQPASVLCKKPCGFNRRRPGGGKGKFFNAVFPEAADQRLYLFILNGIV